MQKLNLKTQLALLVAVMAAPFAGISAAGIIDSNTNTNTTVNSSVRLTGSSTVANDEDVSSSVVNTTINSNSGANLSADADIDEDISIEQDSNEVEGNIGGRIQASKNMKRSDLKAFAQGELRGDKNLTHVTFGKDNLEVGYKQPGRFIGILPFTMNARAIVASDGKVLVHYPWYNFLVIGDKAEVKAAIESEVKSYFNSSTPLTLTPGIQAELVARIKAILEVHFMNASASSTGSGRVN